MPPSRRSGSSHSSRSRSSSSRSSSSRSSSRSSSSRSSSSRSSSSRTHSRSSHSSHSRFDSSTGRSSRRQPIREPRTRRNQPLGYSNHDVIRHICRTHDYMYFPESWVYNGQTYTAGYYDEEGRHYNNVVIKDTETICKCSYCDTKMKIKWEGGALPHCTNCGAPLDIEVMDSAEIYHGANTKSRSASDSSTVTRRQKRWMIIGIIVLVIGFSSAVSSSERDSSTNNNTANNSTDQTETSNAAEGVESIYVEEIGRTCIMDSDGNFYDKTSGCYFWFNTDLDPSQWQYWYEGISDNYGDYGWMEYDQYEEQWYIETDNNEWIRLPEQYETSELWHFTDAYTY